MKTTILTIALFAATILGFNQSATAATGKTEGATTTTLTNVSNISEIEIRGNVELYVSAGTADQVKVYNNYYANNALVQDDKGVLRIASYSTQKLTVWVTANQLAKLSVYDNSTVKSFGKLSAINLDVELYNNASAQLNMDAFSANVKVNDNAKANLTGDVTEGSLKANITANLNVSNLKVSHLTKATEVKSEDVELALL
jgi:hypothetical protein